MNMSQATARALDQTRVITDAEMRVALLTPEHVEMAVDVHIRAFPGFFLAWLGPSFLRQLYKGFLTDPAAVSLVATSGNGQVLGSVLGSLSPEGFYRRLLIRRWWAFGAIGAAAVARKPSVIPRLARGLIYRGEPPAGPPRALLDSISVAPEAQGRGVGRALVEQWLHSVKARGATGAFLTTDADNNEQVNVFYKSLGWALEATFRRADGRRMNRYVIDWLNAI